MAIEERLRELPLVQYAWLKPEEIPFSEKVREICREECVCYDMSWSCPPGVGTVEECRARCAQYEGAFVFTTIAEPDDRRDEAGWDEDEWTEEGLAARYAQADIGRRLATVFSEEAREVLLLSGESCNLCYRKFGCSCTYPHAPCRFPKKMIPCIEGYGIVVPLLAERAGIVFDNGPGFVTWFGLLLYREQNFPAEGRTQI